MTAVIMITLCLVSDPRSCQMHELTVNMRVCQTASVNVAQAWAARRIIPT